MYEEILEHKGKKMAKNDASRTEGKRPMEGEHEQSSEDLGERTRGQQR